VTQASPLGKRDLVVIGILVVLSIAVQSLAAIYFDSTESLLALGGSAIAFLAWVVLRFR
jgi:hypothetical protein